VLEQLVAAAVDVLQVANWQRAGKRSAPRPKPVRRPQPPGKRRGTVSDDEVGAKILDFMERRKAELDRMGGER
jgi:hypothetical protein